VKQPVIRGRRVAGVLGSALAVAAVMAAPADAVTRSWSVFMNGAQQSASGLPGDPDGSGSASITANTDTNQLCATVSWSNLASPVVAAHIHQGYKGHPENPGFTINLFGPNLFGASSPQSSCQIVPGPVILAMDRTEELFMVTVHNQQFPAGAIRGQLQSGPLCQLISPALCVGS
jgi:hypothetical protein